MNHYGQNEGIGVIYIENFRRTKMSIQIKGKSIASLKDLTREEIEQILKTSELLVAIQFILPVIKYRAIYAIISLYFKSRHILNENI